MQSEAQEIDTYTSRNENTNALVGLKDAEKIMVIRRYSRSF